MKQMDKRKDPREKSILDQRKIRKKLKMNVCVLKVAQTAPNLKMGMSMIESCIYSSL